MGKGEIARIISLEERVTIIELEIKKIQLSGVKPLTQEAVSGGFPQLNPGSHTQTPPPAPAPSPDYPPARMHTPVAQEDPAIPSETPPEEEINIYTTKEREQIKAIETGLNTVKADIAQIKKNLHEIERASAPGISTEAIEERLKDLETKVSTLQTIPPAPTQQTPDANIMSLFDNIEKLESEMMQTKDELSALQSDHADTKEKLGDALKLIKALEKAAPEGSAAISPELKEEIDKIKKDITTNKRNITANRNQIKDKK